MQVLVVTNPFGGYALGAEITDAEDIKDILDGEHSGHVVRADRPAAAPPNKDN